MNIKKVIKWFGIIGSIASIFSVMYVFLPRDNSINVSIILIEQEKLTQDFELSEPNLKVDYKFKGLKVSNLWKYNIEITNKSSKTIIGTSTQKNILTDYFTLLIKENYEILDSKVLHSDFNHQLIVDSTSVNIAFEQWRANESLVYSFYIRTKSKETEINPFMKPSFRQIIDGNILFGVQDLNRKNDFFTRKIPIRVLQTSYTISLIFIGLFIFSFTLAIFLIPVDRFRLNKWRRNNFESYTEFINLTDLSEDMKKHRIRYPSNSVMSKFDGDKYPKIYFHINFDKFYQFLGTLLALAIVNISLIFLLIDLVYFFPH